MHKFVSTANADDHFIMVWVIGRTCCRIYNMQTFVSMGHWMSVVFNHLLNHFFLSYDTEESFSVYPLYTRCIYRAEDTRYRYILRGQPIQFPCSRFSLQNANQTQQVFLVWPLHLCLNHIPLYWCCLSDLHMLVCYKYIPLNLSPARVWLQLDNSVHTL